MYLLSTGLNMHSPFPQHALAEEGRQIPLVAISDSDGMLHYAYFS